MFREVALRYVWIALLAAASCAGARPGATDKPLQPSRPAQKAHRESPAVKPVERVPADVGGSSGALESELPSEEGLASYYHDSLAGRSTANGEKYRPDAKTCAHRTLPFNTLVEVTTDAGKMATCRINDRGPFVDGRVIDVSKRLARELDMLGPGVLKVRVQPMPGSAASP